MRRFEREADRMAFTLTGISQTMINVLKLLAKDNLINLHHPYPELAAKCFHKLALGFTSVIKG